MEGNVLWLKIGLMFFTGIIIPLFIPRRYIPVDAKVGITLFDGLITQLNPPGTHDHYE
jgi:hypothetical protein